MSHRILIIEDDPDIREAERALFELDGYQVTVAENGQDAVEHLRQCIEKGNGPCVILLDLMMPVMDGWEFLRWRQKEKDIAKVPTVVVTAADETSTRSINADDVLTKPLDLGRMMDIVRLHCEPEWST